MSSTALVGVPGTSKAHDIPGETNLRLVTKPDLGGDQQKTAVDSPVAEESVNVTILRNGERGVLSLTKSMLEHANPVIELSPESTNKICSALGAE